MIRATISRADIMVTMEFPDSKNPFAILSRCMKACDDAVTGLPIAAVPDLKPKEYDQGGGS